MSVRRSRLEIMLQVLSAVKKGTDKPTKIMYAANLSWKPTQRYLSKLVEQELIHEISVRNGKRSRKRYEITEKGVNVLKYFMCSEDLIKSQTIY